jgi:hypothetical protein
LNISLRLEPHLDVTVEHCDVLAEQVPEPGNVHTCRKASAMWPVPPVVESFTLLKQ